jgi:superfamily II DNA or RNA helicase
MRGVRGRVLVSAYQTFTQPEALRALRQFPNIELRMATTGNFHAKGYLFGKHGINSLLLGSSNLTANALRVNTEWNLLVQGNREGELLADVLTTFAKEFDKGVVVDEAFIQSYEEVYRAQARLLTKAAGMVEEWVAVHPNAMQVEALGNLAALRAAGEKKALLISATGTGKTYLSAFDAQAVMPRRLLFVVHRANIAKAALRTFQRVFGASRSMGIYSGGRLDTEADFLFCTVQTLSRESHLFSFPQASFDYIVVDETHRSGAESYQRLLSYFKPSFLLGMTATPERTDGVDIFSQFDHNIAYEIRLQRALEEEMLCPFQYFGVTDVTVGGRIVEEEAGFSLLVNEERVRHILDRARFYGCDSGEVRGLVFCRSVEECVGLSAAFNKEGIYRTRALAGGSSEDERAEAIQLLESDNPLLRLHYLFTVDIFNEGIDIPRLNQVILLRPTKSAIIFVQQLGRGLRKVAGKEYLTVIDFIGNYSSSYLIPIALFGDTSYNKDTLRKLLAAGSSLLPGASTINFDRIAQERIFSAIDTAKLDGKRELVNDYKLLRYQLGRMPSMVDVLAHGGRDPYQYVKAWGSYYAFVKAVGEQVESLSEEAMLLLRLISTFLADGKRVEEVEIIWLLLAEQIIDFERIQAHLLAAYGLEFDALTFRSCIRNINFDFVKEPRAVVEEVEGVVQFAPGFLALLENEVFVQFLTDTLAYARARYAAVREKSVFHPPFFLYEKYSRRDVCRLLNWDSDESSTVYGYKLKQGTLPLFVNYHKEADIASSTNYADGFVSPSLFDWESKSQRRLTSPEIVAMQGGELFIPLFIKKHHGEGDDFYFMGEVRPLRFLEAELGGKPVVQVRFALTPAVEDSVYGYLVGGDK